MRLSNEKLSLYSFIGIGMELWLCTTRANGVTGPHGENKVTEPIVTPYSREISVTWIVSVWEMTIMQ